MTLLVSILIPAYNAQEWIADTIESALGQTWPRKEIIVVDDGSTDRTRSIAQQFASKELCVVTQAHEGAAAARNKAFALSQGDCIQWLDADDLLAPDKIARQIAVLESCPSNRTLLSSSCGRFIYRPYRARFSPSLLWCDLSPLEWLLRKMEHNVYMQTATWLASRELTQAAGPWDNRLLADDDGEYFCRVILASAGIRFVPQARTFYRMSGFNSLSYLGGSQRKLEAHFLSMRLHVEYIRLAEDSPRSRAACLKFLQRCLILFYPERPDIVKQAEQLAATLGGQLALPQLGWKYAWIQKVFGWNLAKRAQILTPKLKGSLVCSWDKALFRWEKRKVCPMLK